MVSTQKLGGGRGVVFNPKIGLFFFNGFNPIFFFGGGGGVNGFNPKFGGGGLMFQPKNWGEGEFKWFQPKNWLVFFFKWFQPKNGGGGVVNPKN